MMEKMDMQSPDFVEENIAKLAALFPGCVTETASKDGKLKKSIDFDLLRQELSDHIVEGPQERYHLNWPGKREALLSANAPIAKTLRPSREESVDFDTTENLFIEGDNLDALKLLQETYLGKVKLIYIDPPYNTGKDFIYRDDFAESAEDYLLGSGQKDEEGNRLVANTDTNGRFHSDWLSMMYSRLKLARNFLRDDGFIVLSVDDAEYENLIRISREIFGETNYLATLVWDKNRKNDAKYFSVGHEYMLVFSKNKHLLDENGVKLREQKEGLKKAIQLFENLKRTHKGNIEQIQQGWRDFFNGLPGSDPMKKLGRYSKVNERGPYRDDRDISWPGGGGPDYEVLHPVTKKPCKQPSRGWVFSAPERFWEEYDNGRVVFGVDETTTPRIASYLFESNTQVMPSVFYSYAQTITQKFSRLMGGKIFDNPKGVNDLQRVINYLSSEGDVVLDFFAGSSTTAHAVMQLNAEDGGNRKFIMVQLPEPCDEKSEANKAGYKTIAEISKERIRRAGKNIKEASPLTTQNLDTGFRVLKIDTSNMADVYHAPDLLDQKQLSLLTDNIKPDRSGEDLLFQVLLDWGVDLSLPISKQTILEREVFFVDDNALAACFAKDGRITEEFCKELASRQPLRVVFRDAGFKDDSVKINVEQIFKLMSPNTDIRTL